MAATDAPLNERTATVRRQDLEQQDGWVAPLEASVTRDPGARRAPLERSGTRSCWWSLSFTVVSYAEGVGFEPTRHCCPPVFKTGSIGRSDSPPGWTVTECNPIILKTR